jgi:hypothetical protein
MFPRLINVISDIVGYLVLKVSTAFLQPGGMVGLVVGCFSFFTAFASPAGFALGLLCSCPRNVATGHVMAVSMQQSSLSRRTVASRVERGRGSPCSHLSHQEKKLRAS